MPAITEEKEQEKRPASAKKQPAAIAETNGLKEADKTSYTNGDASKNSSDEEKSPLRANSTPEQGTQEPLSG